MTDFVHLKATNMKETGAALYLLQPDLFLWFVLWFSLANALMFLGNSRMNKSNRAYSCLVIVKMIWGK